MDRIKTIGTYIIWIVAFFIFSNFLIYIGLNASYVDIERMDNLEEVQIYQAQATKTDGRINGIVVNTNNTNEYLTGKFVKISLYSERDVLVKEEIIQIDLVNKEQQVIDFNFTTDNVHYYNIEIVGEK